MTADHRRLIKEWDRRLHQPVPDELPSGSLSDEDYERIVYSTLKEPMRAAPTDEETL